MTLAFYYDLHHSNYLDDLPYWLDLAREKGSPLLELGCGSGRVALPLAQDGHTVYGLDNDFDMLKLLQAKLLSDLDVRLLLADLTGFHLAADFPLILMPCNTYSTLPEARRLAAIECVTSHLRPGGMFAFSMPNPALLSDLKSELETELEQVFSHPDTGFPLQVSSSCYRNPDSVVVRWHYDHLMPDGRVERDTAEVVHYLISVEQFSRELHQAGFLIELFGDFDRCTYKKDSPLLLCEASLQ